MNYKKETLELLGYETVECLIPKNLLNDFPEYFTD